MSLKKLLGMESFPIEEEEIMSRIKEAERKHLKEIIFASGYKKVKVKLQQTSPEGMMRDNFFYYDAR